MCSQNSVIILYVTRHIYIDMLLINGRISNKID